MVRRNAVRSGLYDARDRATKRRRRRRERSLEDQDAHAGLRAWLDAALDGSAPDELERFDLRRFLQETAAFDLPTEERLRQLAIALEREVASTSARRDWSTIDRVYQRALRVAPDDWMLHSSRSVSACHVAELADDPADAERLFEEADASIRRAISLHPCDAELHYEAGYARYARGSAYVEDALALFREAVELDASHGWAQLYLAHCLHDLERYEEALAAYEQVPLEAFEGPASWRTALLVEQRAHCRLMLGDEAGARADLERAVTRYEKDRHLRELMAPELHWWARDGVFPDLTARIAAAAEHPREPTTP